MDNKQIILNSSEIINKINRIAFSIIEDYYKETEITIVGLKKNGHIIGDLLKKTVEKNHSIKVHLHKIKITEESYIIEPKLNINRQKNIFLVDDVLKSGRTMIYGVKELLQYDVDNLKTIILVNRNHNKFPIRADYVGLNLSTTLKEHIKVIMNSGKEIAYLV